MPHGLEDVEAFVRRRLGEYNSATCAFADARPERKRKWNPAVKDGLSTEGFVTTQIELGIAVGRSAVARGDNDLWHHTHVRWPCDLSGDCECAGG